MAKTKDEEKKKNKAKKEKKEESLKVTKTAADKKVRAPTVRAQLLIERAPVVGGGWVARTSPLAVACAAVCAAAPGGRSV